MVWSCLTDDKRDVLDGVACWKSIYVRSETPGREKTQKTEEIQRTSTPKLCNRVGNACMFAVSENVTYTMNYCENSGCGNVGTSLLMSHQNLVKAWAEFRVSDNDTDEDKMFHPTFVLILVADLRVTVGGGVGLGSVNSIKTEAE